jgi:hypothetical protein
MEDVTRVNNISSTRVLRPRGGGNSGQGNNKAMAQGASGQSKVKGKAKLGAGQAPGAAVRGECFRGGRARHF